MINFTTEHRDGRGRCAVAITKLTEGTLLINAGEECLVSFPTFSSLQDLCACCLDTNPEKKLMKCANCGIIRYCGKDHQRKDWKFHKHECKSLLGNPVLLNGLRERLGDDSMMDIFLCARMIIKYYNGDNKSSSSIPKSFVDCVELHHYDDRNEEELALEEAKINVMFDTILSKLYKKSLLTFKSKEEAYQTARFIMRKFPPNNFGIVNELQTLIGDGVYPIGAILNHSCQPNCVLIYKGSKQFIRVLRGVDAGEELTHSYVDLCSTTKERKERLRGVYKFDCDCVRCDDRHSDNWQTKIDQAMTSNNLSFSMEDLLARSHTLQELDRTEPPNNRHEEENEERHLKWEYERVCQTIYAMQSNHGLMQGDKRLYREHCEAHSLSLMLYDYANSLFWGRKVLSFLNMSLDHVGIGHPLLNLTMMTVADILKECGKYEEAVRLYAKVEKGLSICYGHDSSFVRMTQSQIKSCEGEL